jgi:hypothetical protein
VFSVLIFSCQNTKKQKSEQQKLTKDAVQSTEYATKSGKNFIVSIDHSLSASIDYVQIETSNFDAVNSNHIVGEIDPVEEVIIADLDGNGFEEIYLLTRSAGSGSYGNIYGIVSNRDKSATPFYVPEISEREMEKGGLFEGFMGHNKFEIEDGKLVNSFPVYRENDSNANPTGGNRKIVYGLIAGEAGWILRPQQIIQ